MVSCDVVSCDVDWLLVVVGHRGGVGAKTRTKKKEREEKEREEKERGQEQEHGQDSTCLHVHQSVADSW